MLQALAGELFVNRRRGRDRGLELSPVNEECLVNAREKPALTVSLIFVHTARRSYRFEWIGELFGVLWVIPRSEVLRAYLFRGRRSRNKASVGEPADGSFAPAYD